MEFINPKSLNEALKALSKTGHQILAGGTDICTLINGGFIKPKGLINIWGLDELRGIKEVDNLIKIGSLTTHTEIVEDSLIGKYVPALSEACRTIGARQIQNRGTIGGNVMNASPAGDTLPVLLAYDAEVDVASTSGSRSVKFSDFFKGYRKTALKSDEIITAFKIPKTSSGERSAFLKVGTRKAQAISKVMACFRINIEGAGICAGSECAKVSKIAIAYGSVAPVPVRATKTEALLAGQNLTDALINKAVKSVRKEVTPIDDIRSTADYRRHVSGVLLSRFLKSL